MLHRRLTTIITTTLLISSAMGQSLKVTELDITDISRLGIPFGNYSGITHIDGNRYAVVSDKETAEGFFPMTIDINPSTGKVTAVSRGSMRSNIHSTIGADGNSILDIEDIVWHEPTCTFFLTAEGTQEILQFDTLGQPTGTRMQIPTEMKRDKIAANYGFESLAYNRNTGIFWTTTESTLPADGVCASPQSSGVHNVLRIQSFGNDLKPLRQYAYRTDIPMASGAPRNYAHGVPAICALDDGRLLILEREFFVPKKIIGSFVECRLYLVDPSRSTVINADTRLGAIDEYDFMAKTLISSWTTTLNLARRDIANYEGMCLGPRLTDGRQTLILVNDSQGGYGNSLLRLHDYIKVVALE